MFRSSIQYLARNELYSREKPYSADFEIDEQKGARKSNLIITSREVDVTPFPHRNDFDINVHGFCLLHEDTNLTVNDALEKPEEVELVYQAELEAILHKHFPEYKRFESLDFVVRRRDPRYPSEMGEIAMHEQPAALAHSDYTVDGSIIQLKGSFPGQESHFQNEDYDMINVWRPLVGPNMDWPLAICDYTSVQPKDIIKADVLHTDRVTENQLLHPNEQHRWYYVADQQTNDLIVFRNIDSTGKRAVGFHAAVHNPISDGPPRISCEVRFVAFR